MGNDQSNMKQRSMGLKAEAQRLRGSEAQRLRGSEAQWCRVNRKRQTRNSKHTYGFTVASYDKTKDLIIDDVRLYNRTLSEQEIHAIIQEPLEPGFVPG